MAVFRRRAKPEHPVQHPSVVGPDGAIRNGGAELPKTGSIAGGGLLANISETILLCVVRPAGVSSQVTGH